ncbi:WS/DGAT domain-containing protein [Frankia sp. BMG5.23]|uniref:WS/DGAT domain-containing protein n=1 Tax=Frankia sp. BMG5.23 TaxID=683305 RepID=UPI000460C8BA|nr:WS/DGAT domain-containing protein [Frankia sp. BMG5.23]KDA41740.1 Diacylglycerol O-acyltransferase [Frankia sp. BMG5.23]
MALLDVVTKAGPERTYARPLTSGDRAYLAFSRLNPGEFQDVGALLFVDGPPLELADLRAHVAERLRDPRARMLTDRLETVAVRFSGRRSTANETLWVRGPGLNVDDHVVAMDLPSADGVGGVGGVGGGDGGAGDARLRAAVDRIAAQPIDLSRSPWMLYLLRAPGSSGTVLVYRTSHIQQDGFALYQALHLLFGGEDELDLGLPPAVRRPRPSDYAGFVGRGLRCLAPTRALDAWGGPPAGPARHSWVTTDLGTLRAVARHHDVTVNDVYLAALAGALRTWSLPEWRRDRQPIHALMPISFRTAAERNVLSNYSSGVRVPLPCGEPDPGRRLAWIAAETRRMKKGGLGVVERHHFSTLATIASPRMLAGAAAYPAQIRKMALVASNVRTMRGPLAVAGRAVTGLVGTGQLLVGRQHLAVAMLGIDERVGLTFVASASVPNHARLGQLWLAELDVLSRLVPSRRRERA